MRRSHHRLRFSFILVLGCFAATVHAQAPEGPMTPQPGVVIQQAPPQTKFKLQSILVNTPVTVRDAKGEMVHDLERRNFRLTDNGVEQKISHFDLGSDPLSLVVVVETSSRLDAILPEVRKTGILLTQTVMGRMARQRLWALMIPWTSCRTSPRTPTPSKRR